jgi:hypothetical protein
MPEVKPKFVPKFVPRYVPGDRARNKWGMPGFIEMLAKARNISLEEAETQYFVDEAEETIVGKNAPLADDQNPMFEPMVVIGVGSFNGKGSVVAENGVLLSAMRATTPEEDLQHLIDDTERKMTEQLFEVLSERTQPVFKK